MKNKLTLGVFNYLDESVTSSLYRNGKVLTERDLDGNDFGTEGLVVSEKQVEVINARLLDKGQKPTWNTNGFELLQETLEDQDLDFFDHQSVVGGYYQQCVATVESVTAARAFAFDHNIRSASGKQAGKRIAGGQQVQEPLHFVHGDYTLTSAPQRLMDLTSPPSANDTLASVLQDGKALISKADQERVLAGGRFAIINVWRNITPQPVAIYPLALCDSRSVQPEDLVVFEIHYRDRIGENYFAKHAAAHRWYYYPQITRDEALLIKQWDSAGMLARSNGECGDGDDPDQPCTFSYHSAFHDPDSPEDAPDRCSIEVRCMVIYD